MFSKEETLGPHCERHLQLLLALFGIQKDKFLSNLLMEVHIAKKEAKRFLNQYDSNHGFLQCAQKMVQ